MTEQNLQAQLDADQRHRPRSPQDEFSFREFGGPTYRTERLVTVTANPTQVLPNDPNRIMWWLTNYGGAELTVRWSPEIAAGVGILVGAGGGFLQQDIRADGNAVGDELWGIVAAGTSGVYVVEVRIGKIISRG